MTSWGSILIDPLCVTAESPFWEEIEFRERVRRSGRAEHFGLRAHSRHDEVPWSAVVRIEGDRIIVSDASAPTSDRAKRPQRSYARRTK